MSELYKDLFCVFGIFSSKYIVLTASLSESGPRPTKSKFIDSTPVEILYWYLVLNCVIPQTKITSEKADFVNQGNSSSDPKGFDFLLT